MDLDDAMPAPPTAGKLWQVRIAPYGADLRLEK